MLWTNPRVTFGAPLSRVTNSALRPCGNFRRRYVNRSVSRTRSIVGSKTMDHSANSVAEPSDSDDENKALERWLREEVVPACIEIEANPASGISSAELLNELEKQRQLR